MILRRLTEHVKEQNWFAVAIEFVIVVSGVFLGIQIGNFNSDQVARRDYVEARARYADEIRTNLAILDGVDIQIAGALKIVSTGFNALRSCEETPDNRAAVDAALGVMAGTIGIFMRDDALAELTENPRLLALQSSLERRSFNDARYLLRVFMREADFVETLPLAERMENNPLIAIGDPARRDVTYVGVDYWRAERRLLLAAPIDVACTDNALAKSFYYWERWQGVLPAISRNLRSALESNLAFLEDS